MPSSLSISYSDLMGLVPIVGAIAVLILLSEFLRHRLSLHVEFTRKMVHVGTGLVIFFAPRLVTGAGAVLLLAATFTIANALATRYGLLRAMHGGARRTWGTALYPLSLFILAFFLWEHHPGVVATAMLVLALGDGAAGAVGELLAHPRVLHFGEAKKSLEGSATMALASCLALAVAVPVYLGAEPGWLTLSAVHPILPWCTLLAIALVATGWEALAPRGLDNLTVPLAVGLLLFFLIVSGNSDLAVRFLFGLLLAAGIAVLATRARLLDRGGALATFLLAVTVFGFGGWQWTLPIVVFFILSSVLPRLTGRRHGSEGIAEKDGPRDLAQVGANGGLAGLLVLGSLLLPALPWYPAYLGAVAAAAADTWSTEFGALSTRPPRDILTLRPVLPGTSGGVTLLGSLGGIGGALSVALAAVPWGSVELLVLVVLAGVLGGVTDSLLGALVQSRRTCPLCGISTERLRHCDTDTVHSRGWRWMNNDAVNLLCTLAGAAAMVSATLLAR